MGDENPNSMPVFFHVVALISPFCVPSIAPTMPSAGVSRFSSPWDTNTVFPCTATPVLMARFETGKLHTFSPVCGLMACTAPSPRPSMSSRWPPSVAMSGGA